MNHNQPTVLLVDDDRALTELLSLRLRECGFETTAADHALQALNLQHEKPHDLVVMDVNMPSGNGLSVCELLAFATRARTTPIIVLTGSSDESTLVRCRDLGVHYIQKGEAAVRKVCELARQMLLNDIPKNPATSLHFG